jgi:phage terminase large subunit-like protein
MGAARRKPKPLKPEPYVLTVPDDGDVLYPTLGPLVCDWMEANLVFGPGDLRGEPLVLDDEQRMFIYRMYEIMPEDHPEAGRRRFRRCALSLPKGLRKTELAALIGAAELSDDAPVRFAGWDGKGNPKGRPVTDPFVVFVAYTEEQSDELAYGALRAILSESPIAHRFDIGLERVMRIGGDGKAVSLAGSPNARDGARTTWQCFDETHWHTLEKLKRAHQTMMANLPKRKLADAWALEVTTAYEPGAGSIAEMTMDYARAVHEGRVKDAKLFFYHRQANDRRNLDTEEGARAAVIDATGVAALGWRDIEAIVDLWKDPTTDRRYWERVWCNRPVQSARRAFDLEAYRSLKKGGPAPQGSLITIGFDGAQFRDATAIVATEVRTGHQWLAGIWEAPHGVDNWQVPAEEVDACIDTLFQRYNVWRMYADPPYWQSWLSTWQGRYGDERVIEWWTNRRNQMAAALEAYDTAIRERALTHDGHEALVRHIGNAHRHELPQRDEHARPLWLIRKDRADSPFKIDAAMAAVLSWEARKDAVAAGVLGQDTVFSREWLEYWKTEPRGGNRYVLVYPANERQKKSQHTEIVVVELREDQRYYVIDMVRDRLSLTDRADLVFELHRTHQPLRVAYDEHGLESDQAHLRERQERENYRFTLTPVAGRLSADERIRRLVPLFEAKRIVLPEKLPRKVNGVDVDMVQAFLAEEYLPYPLSAHSGLLDCLSRVLDINADFPAAVKYTPPAIFPSEW